MLKKETVLASFFGIIIGTGLGMILYKSCFNPAPINNNTSEVSINLDSLLKKDKIKIDSLKKEIYLREEKISRLKDSIQVKEIIRTVEIDNIKKLPLDSSVTFLNLKLREYENMY